MNDLSYFTYCCDGCENKVEAIPEIPILFVSCCHGDRSSPHKAVKFVVSDIKLNLNVCPQIFQHPFHSVVS